MYLKRSVFIAVLGISTVATGCAARAATAKEAAAPLSPIKVNIMNDKGLTIGTAQFKQLAKGVQVDVAASGLMPGPHGVHIHQTGKCELPDFKSAGEHFNPAGTHHGFDNPQGPHAGDMPNLVVGSDGKAEAQFILTAATLQKGAPNSMLHNGGTSLIIHEKVDDMHTDPSGNSGNRIACAVIK